MESFILLIAQGLAEAVGDFFGYLLVDAIINRLGWSKKAPWYVLAFAAIVSGLFWGVLSMTFATHHIIASKSVRVATIIVTPLLCAAIVSLRRRFLMKRGRAVFRFEHFIYVYLFTVAFLLFRHFKIE